MGGQGPVTTALHTNIARPLLIVKTVFKAVIWKEYVIVKTTTKSPKIRLPIIGRQIGN